MNFAIAHAAMAFWRTKRLAARFRTRDDVLRWRSARVQSFLEQAVSRAPYYAELRPRRLEDLPIVDKALLMARFAAFNTRGIDAARVRAALDRGEGRLDGLSIGQSTGTSGNRGFYVISEAERFTWLGVMLAKTLPDFPLRAHKVALALPGYSRLYASAAATGRLQMRFFDLALGVEVWREDLCAYAPDTIVAPPKVLRALADSSAFRPENVFSGAEILDPLDREYVEARLGVKVREIYMATEGLFGVACAHGTLHLAEDCVAFEFAPVGDGLVSPLITDFTRRTQIMARYRMNDLLRLSDAPCACGSPLQCVARIEGRQDDVFILPGVNGARVMATPDIVRNAIIDADRRIMDFRVTQTGANEVEIALPEDYTDDVCAGARAALSEAFAKLGAVAVAIVLKSGIETPFDRKLRRVRRAWSPPN